MFPTFLLPASGLCRPKCPPQFVYMKHGNYAVLVGDDTDAPREFNCLPLARGKARLASGNEVQPATSVGPPGLAACEDSLHHLVGNAALLYPRPGMKGVESWRRFARPRRAGRSTWRILCSLGV